MTDECLDVLCEVVNQACYTESDSDMGVHLDSMALSSYADALIYLEKRGRVEILLHEGRRIIAHWKEEKP